MLLSPREANSIHMIPNAPNALHVEFLYYIYIGYWWFAWCERRLVEHVQMYVVHACIYFILSFFVMIRSAIHRVDPYTQRY